MATLLDRIHAEIRERLEQNRPAAEEYERLEAALAVLESRPAASERDDAEPPALAA